MDSFAERVQVAIAEHELLEPTEQVIVGLSGGVDSIVLATVLRILGHPVRAVHVNYRLRGAASDQDEAFVRSWCAERGVELFVADYDTTRFASDRSLSIQHAARKLRYSTLVRAALDNGASKVAVGHHRDDQAETVLINLFRGTGLEGLAGMPRKRSLQDAVGVALIRPLLDISRSEIENYARAQGLSWREDASNMKAVYRRGALRSEILPVVERHFGPSVLSKVAQAADLVRAYLSSALSEDLRSAFEAASASDDGNGVLHIAALEQMPAVIQKRLIIEAVRRWMPEAEASSTMVEEIADLLSAQPGRYLEWSAGQVWREREHLLFLAASLRRGSEDPATLHLGGEAPLHHGTVRAEILDEPPADFSQASSDAAYLDARSVPFPVVVRLWTDGDRFAPLGMEHSKKLSDFLTDERVPPHRKRNVYVVVSEGRIVWVVGHRISHTDRVKPDTTRTICLSYHPAGKPGPRQAV